MVTYINKFCVFLIIFFSMASKAQLATPNESGLTYGLVHLNVTDIELHKGLWVEHFDGVVVQKGPLTTVQMPNMIITLSEQEVSAVSRDTVMDHFGFKVRSIDDFLAKWRTAGYDVGPEFIGAEGQKNAYVTMPDGAYVELQEDQALHEDIVGYHVHFYTDQYKELLEWYTEIFSLDVRPRGNIETTTNVPGMNLSFANSSDERLPTRGTAIDRIGFEVADLEAFCRELESKGVVFLAPLKEAPSIGLKVALIVDPAGVTIELTEGLIDY
jgi:catechol 2,3-dioxygenase-like lactoylglutathione lyase family enzyme